jgi:hypothetical protein
MASDSAKLETEDVSLPPAAAGLSAAARDSLPRLSSTAQSGMFTVELQSPHLVVFSGGTAFNGIAGFMRKEFPRGLPCPPLRVHLVPPSSVEKRWLK